MRFSLEAASVFFCLLGRGSRLELPLGISIRTINKMSSTKIICWGCSRHPSLRTNTPVASLAAVLGSTGILMVTPRTAQGCSRVRQGLCRQDTYRPMTKRPKPVGDISPTYLPRAGLSLEHRLDASPAAMGTAASGNWLWQHSWWDNQNVGKPLVCQLCCLL